MEPTFAVGVPDPSFRLSAEEKAAVAPAFDPDALERLLSMYPPEGRTELLRRFQQMPDDAEPRVRLVVRLGHPELQAALEEVWAPYWDSYTDEQMDAEVGYLPRREAARKRRVIPPPESGRNRGGVFPPGA
jgi:hypothetical protein